MSVLFRFRRPWLAAIASLSIATVIPALTGCASAPSAPRAETVIGLTADGRLLRFNAGQPQALQSQVAISGLAQGDRLVDIDYRVARGQLFGLASSGRLYRLDPASGRAQLVGTGAPLPLTLAGAIGIDFNPTVDRLRVVTASGQSLRLHPDTGALVDGDPAAPGLQPDAPLAYAAGDVNAGKAPQVAAVAYTYNKQDEKITTNYAIDGALNVLAIQGSREGAQPVVSPNTGRLSTVGPLGLALGSNVTFDIADINNVALATGTRNGRSTLYLIDLETGRAKTLGVIGGNAAVIGIAIEP